MFFVSFVYIFAAICSGDDGVLVVVALVLFGTMWIELVLVCVLFFLR